jgi:predicted phage terminase large subunit-like protein
MDDLTIGRAILHEHFLSFLRYAFALTHPTRNLSRAPYLEAFAFQLQRCEQGENRRLLVNMPPRHLKSFSLIAFQAWMLGRTPHLEITAASYGEELSRAHARLFREIVSSRWYRDIFPAMRVSERGDRILEIRTTQGGVRRAFSVGGPGTGFGGDIIMCDDLTKAQDVNSPAMRESLERYVHEVLLTRFNDPATGVLISAQQRLHIDDIVVTLGRLRGVFHMSLPAIAERPQIFPLYEGRKWRRKVGDLLDPERVSRTELDEIRERSPMVYASQHQQAPKTTISFMIDMSRVRFVDEPPSDPLIRVQFWDTATVVSQDSDWSVGTCWVWKDDIWHLVDMMRGKWAFPALKEAVLAFHDKHEAHQVKIEHAGSGIPLVQQLRSERRYNFWSREVSLPKDVRFAAITPFLQSPKVAILDHQSWSEDFRREVAGFPFARHDDIVDSVSLFSDFASGPDGKHLIAKALNGWKTPRPSNPARRLAGW